MPARLCSSPGCGGMASYRGKCPDHARQAARARGPRAYDKRRYRYARRRQLFDEPLCTFKLEDGSECGRFAEHCHHVEHLSAGGDPFALSNLMSVCAHHHEELHR